MRRVKLLTLALALALLAPPGASAGPRQLLGPCTEDKPLLALIADLLAGRRLVSEEQLVALAHQTITIRTCSPADELGAARDVLATLARALPLLERHAGAPYSGPPLREIMFIPSPTPGRIYIDGRVLEDGTVELHGESATWTVLHEAAHFWASPEMFEEAWMWEGYAEYLTELAVRDLGLPYRPLLPEGGCDGLPLTRWGHGSPGREHCGYRAGARVFRQLAEAVGVERLRDTAVQLSDGMDTVSSWRLMVALEAQTGADLSPVFAGAVFGDEAAESIQQWGRLRASLARVADAARGLGGELPPYLAAVQQNWARGWVAGTPQFDADMRAAAQQLDSLLPLVELAQGIQARCADAGLTCAQPWLPLPDDSLRASLLAEQLRPAPAALDAFRALQDQARSAGLQVAPALSARLATLDPAAQAAVDHARQVLELGLDLQRRCDAIGAPCDHIWQGVWQAGDLAAAEQAINAHRDLPDAAAAAEDSCGALRPACRRIWHAAFAHDGLDGARAVLGRLANLMRADAELQQRCADFRWANCIDAWQPALLDGDLATAEQRHRTLVALFDRAATLAGRCRALAIDCTGQLATPLRAADLDGLEGALVALEGLAGRAEALHRRCTERGWPCDRSWQAAFGQRGAAGAAAQIARVGAALERLAPASTSGVAAGAGEAGPAAADQSAAKLAFRSGNVELAEQLSAHARRVAALAAWFRWAAVALVAGVLIAGTALAIRQAHIQTRRPRGSKPPRRQPPAAGGGQTDDDLLAALLAGAPRDDGR